jgi:hypothetical protein
MKRTQLIGFFALAVLLICVAIFWHHSHSGVNTVSTGTASGVQTPTDSKGAILPNNLATKRIAPSQADQVPVGLTDRLAQMGITPDMTQSQREEKYMQWYAAESAKIAAQHQHPIEFYGETVDESNQPVAGVNAHLILTESPATPNGIVETNIQSDTQGFFSFSGAIGKLLQVWLDKNGYYVSKSNRIDFDYMGYQPNPNQPEIFHLRKKGVGADLITSKYGMTPYFIVTAPKDGTPVKVDLLQRKAGDSGQLEIQIWIDIDQAAYSIKSWQLRLSIPDGGFVEENDEFPFEAPENGYRSVLEFPSPDEANVHFGISHKTYYIAFGQPRKYGSIDISASDHTGNIILQYVINPDGSRYLEPKDETYVRPQ